MFREWGFLLAEIWILLALAGLAGLVAGWIIWGRRDTGIDVGSIAELELEQCRRESKRKADRIAELEAQMATAEVLPSTDQAVSEQNPADAPMRAGPTDFPVSDAVKPAMLDTPRDGLPDDLKLIKGVGPKLEKLCNSLGVWHFEQIAAWTEAEIAWVDANLEGFKGRVSRDGWVEQATRLARGEDPLP